jgi:hypothetical protein
MKGWELTITDPEGKVWRLSLEYTGLTPFNKLTRLRAANGMRHAPILEHEWQWLGFRPLSFGHPPGWMFVAQHGKPDGFKKMWLSPASTKAEAREGLSELAQHIQAGKPLSTFGQLPEDQE